MAIYDRATADRSMTQAERLRRRDQLRSEIAEHEASLAELRAEEARLLESCEHIYADGRRAVAGAQVKICAVCGRVLPGRDDKLWG
jgi:hypothetical protein